MSYYLRSIQDEYDDKGNYIGNSSEGNKFHGVNREPVRPSLFESPRDTNTHADPIEVEHASLEKDYPGSLNARCPVCEFGTLINPRDLKTLEILSGDRCVLCKQRFIYTDSRRSMNEEQTQRCLAVHAHRHGFDVLSFTTKKALDDLTPEEVAEALHTNWEPERGEAMDFYVVGELPFPNIDKEEGHVV